MSNKMKVAALAALVGTVFQFGGCLGGNWQRILWTAAISQGAEWVLDNDGVFDLFDDGDRDTDADGVLNNDGDN